MFCQFSEAFTKHMGSKVILGNVGCSSNVPENRVSLSPAALAMFMIRPLRLVLSGCCSRNALIAYLLHRKGPRTLTFLQTSQCTNQNNPKEPTRGKDITYIARSHVSSGISCRPTETGPTPALFTMLYKKKLMPLESVRGFRYSSE